MVISSPILSRFNEKFQIKVQIVRLVSTIIVLRNHNNTIQRGSCRDREEDVKVYTQKIIAHGMKTILLRQLCISYLLPPRVKRDTYVGIQTFSTPRHSSRTSNLTRSCRRSTKRVQLYISVVLMNTTCSYYYEMIL